MALMLNDGACGDTDSPLTKFDQLYQDAAELLCSQECPCAGNPKLFENEFWIIDDGSSCPPNENCLYFDYTSEMYDA